MEKTAMQVLHQRVKMAITESSGDYRRAMKNVDIWIESKLLEQEKEQIADAFDRGWDAHYNKQYATTGINYYLKTFQ